MKEELLIFVLIEVIYGVVNLKGHINEINFIFNSHLF